MVLSIIDLGSNSIRMDMVSIDEDSRKYEFLNRYRNLVRLSEGMNMDGNIQPESIERAIGTLLEYKEIIDEYENCDVIAVATAAVRNAGNGDEFVNQVMKETGIAVRIIKGEQEAEYDFLGVSSTLDIDDCVIVDTGGGSTEIILVNDNEPLARTSIPVGAINMTEQFLFRGESGEALECLSDYVGSQLDKIHWLDDANGLPIVGMGGSIYNFALVKNKGEEMHGCSIKSDSFAETFSDILNMSDIEREDSGIELGRVDTIVAGVMPINELLSKIESEGVIVSTAGLKEGIIAEFIEDTL